MRYLKFAGYCAVVLSFGAVFSSRALADNCGVTGNLIANCGFETGTFSSWTLTGDPVANQVFNGFPHTGTYDAELGQSGTPATLTQTFTDTSGAALQLTFWLENQNAGFTGGVTSFIASVGSDTLFNLSPAQDSIYHEYSASFTGTGTDTLTFTFQNDPSLFELDDISVAPTAAATPEPSSMVLLGSGLMAAAGMARRRMQRA